MTESQARIPLLSESELDPAAAEVLDRLRGMGNGRILHIFAALAHHPDLLRRWLVFGNHVMGKSTLSPRERELVILRVGWLCAAEYEWSQHVVIARATGLGEDEIRRVADGPQAPGWSPREAALLRGVDELVRTRDLADETFEALRKHLDVPELLDTIFAVGQYVLVSTVLRALRIPLDPGLGGFEETVGRRPPGR